MEYQKSQHAKAVLKRPLYMRVYDELYQRIVNETYSPGEQLPGENQLAGEMSVSRGTLRQALLVLQEEGLIFNHQGKGNFVCKNNRASVNNVPLCVGSPVFQFAKGADVKTSVSLLAEPINDYISKELNLDTTTLLVTLHQIFEIGDQVVSYGITLMGHVDFQQYGLDLTDQEQLVNFTNSLVYERCKSSSVKAMITQCDDFLSEKLDVEPGTVLWCWRESLYSDADEVYAINKYYLLPEYFSITFNRGKQKGIPNV